MRQITFLQDFATKTVGQTIAVDGQIASHLVKRGVAVYTTTDATVLPEEEVIDNSADAAIPEPTASTELENESEKDSLAGAEDDTNGKVETETEKEDASAEPPSPVRMDEAPSQKKNISKTSKKK